MGQLVNIQDFKMNRAVDRARNLWRRRFSDKLDVQTRLADLSDATLATLAYLGEDVTNLLYDLVVVVLDIGHNRRFDDLDSEQKMRVMDVALFLIDQIRWECLRRIDWISGFPAEEYPLIDLILDYEPIKAQFDPPYPQLNETHPRYQEFITRRELDGEAMIRSMIPAALAAFTKKS